MEQKLDGDPISWVQWRIRGSLVLSSGRTEHIGGGLWERARSLMDYEVDAHYSEIACGWRTRGPILLYIYFGSQANSIHFLSCDDDRPFNLFLATWNHFQLPSTFRVIAESRLPQIINLPAGRQKDLIAFLTSLSSPSIYFIILSALSFRCDPDRAENICIYGAQADGDQWKQCARVLQRDRLQSGWEWERGWGQGGEGVCTQIANVWERADFYRREVRLNCSKSGVEVANTLSLKIQPA